MNSSETASAAAGSASDSSGIGGHPRGLTTLFFTEMWERFSYYGMRALLILFMVAPESDGGLGFSTALAGTVYGIYTASVYLASLPGGWVADRFLGLRNAVFVGGIVIAAGHFSMAVPGLAFFYSGLAMIVIGTGLLKPNISAMVGELYSADDARRDGGYSIYYMGINIGAFASPLVCGTLGQTVGWHWGFASAGVGMVFGLIQYKLTAKYLGRAGLKRQRAEQEEKTPPLAQAMWLGGLGVIVAALFLDLPEVQKFILMALGSTSFIASLYVGAGHSPEVRRRGFAIYLMFWASAVFWSGFEQAGSSLNLFADRMTRLEVFGWAFPSSWFQSLNPLYIFCLAPVFSVLWVKLGRRNPSSPGKFSFGLLFAGAGFLLLAIAAMGAGGSRVSPMWLVSVYLLHTIGELCLSPVGLSVMSKLAPPKIVGQIMGVWFLSTAIGQYMAGVAASMFEELPLDELFGWVAALSIGMGLLLAALVKPIRKLMEGVH